MTPGPRSALLALVVLAGASSAAPVLPPGARTAVLPLSVNGVEAGDATVLFDGTDALVRVGDIEAAGLHGFAGSRRHRDGEDLVSLASLAPDVTWTFDATNLRLSLVVAPALLPRERRDLLRGRPPDIEYASSPSAFLNYSVTVDHEGRFSGFSEAGWSLGRALLYASASRPTGGPVVRGLTNVTVDVPERMVRWVAGDALATGGVLGGSAFLAGLSVSRNFALDPYFYRYPGLGVSGAVLTPTRADVYVNGRLVRQETLAPGLFDFSNLPVENGRGETRVVLHDAFGGERTLSTPYYLSTALLAKGLSEYAYGLGFRREDLSTDGFAYGGPVFVGQHRIGLTDRWTAGLRAEAAKGVVSGGATAVASFLPGEVEVAVAASGGREARGVAGYVRTSLNLHGVSVGGYGRLTGDRYATVSVPADEDRPVRDAGLFAGVGLGSLGSLTLQVAGQKWRDAGSTRRLSAFYGVRLIDGVSLFVSAARTRSAGGVESNEVWATVGISLGRRRSVDLSGHHDAFGWAGTATVSSPPPVGEGYGYRLEGTARSGGSGTALADAQVRLPFGVYQASYRAIGGRGSGSATASGGLAAIGGSVFATRPIEQGFALIRVPGVEGVEGTNRNQPVGRTNRSGELLVPDLLPYYGNALGIRDTDVPPEYLVESVRRVVAPPFRGGAVVTFPVRRLRAFSGTLRVSYRGVEVVPAYGVLEVVAGGKTYGSGIGGSGTFYLEGVPPGQQAARVDYLGTSCLFDLRLPDAAGPVAKVGEVTCRTDAAIPGKAAPAALAAASRETRSFVPVARAESARPAERRRGTVFAVQVSSCRTRANARAAAARLSARFGTSASVVQVDLGAKGVWHRVGLGRFATPAEARRFREQIDRQLPDGTGAILRLEADGRGTS